MEQKGRVIQIVYRLENSSDDVIEGFEDDEGFEAVEEDAEEDATDRKSSIDSNKQSKELELMMPDIK